VHKLVFAECDAVVAILTVLVGLGFGLKWGFIVGFAVNLLKVLLSNTKPAFQTRKFQVSVMICTPLFGVRGRFRGVKRRKPLRVTFFSFARFGIMWGFFFRFEATG
jgi:hypothetical protein